MFKKLLILILLLCIVGTANSYSADTSHSRSMIGGNPKIPDVLMPGVPEIQRAEIPAIPAVGVGIPPPSSLIVSTPQYSRQTPAAVTIDEEPVIVNHSPGGVDYAPDRLIVKYKSDTVSASEGTSVSRDAVNAGIGATVLADERQTGVPGMEVVKLSGRMSVEQAVSYYSKSPVVEYAEPDYAVYALPVDTLKVSVPINERALSYREQVGQIVKNPDASPISGGRVTPGVSQRTTPTQEIQGEDNGYGYMHISPEERIQMIESSMLTADLPNVLEEVPQANVDLLQYVPYTGSQRNQGNCGNCWVWASTGAIEVAHTVQTGVKDRQSIQYFNSNYNGGTGSSWACKGGWAETFADFHSTTGFKQVIPWSNTNAYYADANACGACTGTLMPATSISTTPSYPVTSISTSNIQAYGVSQSQAIANIKAQINNNKAIWWAFWLPNSSSWSTFSSYWAYQPESALWNPDPYNGIPYTTGGGHAVLIVGYDDTSSDPNERYWKVLNSWGTTSGRPTGVFRLKMNMDYAGVDSDGYLNHLFKVFNVAYGGTIQTGSISVTSSPTGARIWLDGSDTGKNAPYTLTSVPPGTHTVSLKLSGYNDYSTSVSVTSGQTSTVAGTLAGLQTGGVSIQSNPTGATVFLDNVAQGGTVTPTTISSVTTGSHSVRLTKSGYQDWTQSVSVTSGQTTPVSATMTPVTPGSSVTPNDPSFSLLYGLHNTGLSGGTVDADIDAPEAWGVITGSSSVVVAVIDTGVDYNHPDLAANIWTDPATGYHGYDYANGDSNPMDDHGHGTHCAGTIGAVGNNGIGIVGVNWNVKIMPLKFLTASGSGYTSNAILAIQYANSHGAHVISNSWGGGGYSQALKDAIDVSSAVVVCAAGNSGINTDTSPHYPSAYTSSNIIAVAATDNRDALASFSNYGLTSVDVAAPGVSIYSTYPGGQYKYMSGTSMATPHVAGVAALVKAAVPTYTAAQIKKAIISGVDMKPGLTGKCVTDGRINVKNGVAPPDLTSIPTITSISPTSGYNTGNVMTTIAGTNFHSEVTAKLVLGSTVKTGTITSLTSTQIKATFPLTGASAGKYNLIVTNDDTSGVTKTGAFTVKAEAYTYVRKWGSLGTGNNQFNTPGCIAEDNLGYIYVADTNNHRILKFTKEGMYLAKWGTQGTSNGKFNSPRDVTVDKSGNVYVIDTGNNRIQKFTSSGKYLAKWGTKGAGNGQFNAPMGVIVDSSYNVFVADTSNHRIQKFTSSGKYLANWGTKGTGNGQFNAPMNVATDKSGNVYVADTGNNRIQKFTSSGKYLAKWGAKGTTNGKFISPQGVSVDSNNFVYIIDTGNHRVQKFTNTGEFLTKWGTKGTSNSQFSSPGSAVVNSAGIVYIVDTSNNRISAFKPPVTISAMSIDEEEATVDPSGTSLFFVPKVFGTEPSLRSMAGPHVEKYFA